MPLYGYTGSQSGLWEHGSDLGTSTPASYPPEASALRNHWQDPAALRALHSWGSLPRLSDALDVTSFGATPHWVNAHDDDGLAIQRALDAAKSQAVFVPHGTFHIRSPLQVSGAALVGSGTFSSHIHMADPASWPGGPLVQLSGTGSVLQDLGLYSYWHGAFLDITGSKTLIRDLLTEMNATDPAHHAPELEPQTLLKFRSTSGKVFGLCLGQVGFWEDQGVPPVVKVSNTRSPLEFYALSSEHYAADPQVWVTNCSNVSFYAFKFESQLSRANRSGALRRIEDSKDVSVFGGSGNYNIDVQHAQGIFELSRSNGVRLAGLIRKKLPETQDLPKKAIAIDVDSAAAISDTRALLLFEPSANNIVV